MCFPAHHHRGSVPARPEGSGLLSAKVVCLLCVKVICRLSFKVVCLLSVKVICLLVDAVL